LTGLMARELGGRRGAQLVAAAAAVPFCLGGGALMQYVSFDYLFLVLTAYFVVRLLKGNDPRWWLAICGGVGPPPVLQLNNGSFCRGGRRWSCAHPGAPVSQKQVALVWRGPLAAHFPS